MLKHVRHALKGYQGKFETGNLRARIQGETEADLCDQTKSGPVFQHRNINCGSTLCTRPLLDTLVLPNEPENEGSLFFSLIPPLIVYLIG